MRVFSLQLSLEIELPHIFSIFTIYGKVQHNKCIVFSKLIMSQFPSALEGRKRVVGYAILPGNSILRRCSISIPPGNSRKFRLLDI